MNSGFSATENGFVEEIDVGRVGGCKKTGSFVDWACVCKQKTTHPHQEPVMPQITLSAVLVKASRRRRCQTVYRVRNWAAYDAELKQRGSLTMWLSPQAIQAWYDQGPTQRGSSLHLFCVGYSNGVDDALALSLALATKQAPDREDIVTATYDEPHRPRHASVCAVLNHLLAITKPVPYPVKKGLKSNGKGTNLTL